MRSFLYLHATDLVAARRFYTELVGLDEIFYSASEQTVGYRIGELQMTVATHPDVSEPDGWASQLGWSGGTGSVASWGFELDGTRFGAVVESLRRADVPRWSDDPEWVGYWSYPVRDPMGNTVEITTPARDAWAPTGARDGRG